MNKIRFIENRARQFNKKFSSYIQFQKWIKGKKKAILFHPDYVMMTWETYKSMTKSALKEKKPLVFYDEFADYE